MSNTTIQEPPPQALSSWSEQTLPTRLLQPNSDPTASKRVCFYKSGDYKFSGHRMVINARTFKTFDALLDALSKKVPLPFGVRTITTPRGIHLVKGLDDLQDGGCYVCSDQKRVKPLNLDEVNRRQVPWNTTRLLSAGGQRRRQGLQFGRRNEVSNRPTKVTERVAVRTPKRLVVIKNKDPTVKRTIVLQRRTAPTFDALLDYLSQILQFPVLKLYSTDGRRIDGLAALILCSGVIVAAGNEPFKLGNYSFHRTGQMAQSMYIETVEPSTLQPNAQNNKSFSSGRGSRNFSLSSERYIVNQINKSRNGSIHAHQHQHNGSFEKEDKQHYTSMETCGEVDNEHHTYTVPQDDDIEKSFRVNQDGSMTVEMKVRLTIKEEELLHWTTTLSRSSFSKRTAHASISESGNSSPNLNNAISQDSSSISDDESKEENRPAGKGVSLLVNSGTVYESYPSTALGKATFKRTPTPGPRYVKKTASVDSVKKVTESGVQENILGHYSYMDRTVDGESSEGYCIVSRSSNCPIPKPRKTASAGACNKGSHSSMKSSGVAEVLPIQNNGMEITETVMHIYESQGCYDNYFTNDEYSADGLLLHDSTAQDSKPSTESWSHSSSNDCDIDCSWQPPAASSLERQEEEMLSLSSEPVSATHKITNNLSSVTESEAQTATKSQIDLTVNKEKSPKGKKNKKMTSKNNKRSTSTSSSDKKQQQKESVVSLSQNSKQSSPDKLSSSVSLGKKSLSSSESAKNGQKDKGPEKKEEKHQSKKLNVTEKTPKKDSALLVNDANLKKTPPNRQSTNKAKPRDNGHNVNTPTVRPQMKKNMSEILQPKKSLLSGKKTVSKPKSMTENIISSPKKTLELSESVSLPSLNPTPSDIHQYVENWLENVSPEQVPYTDKLMQDESVPQTKVVFQIGGDCEIDEKDECHTDVDEYCLPPGDAVKKSASCLSVPLYHEGPVPSMLHTDQKTRGLCVSMPSVRVDPVPQESRLRAHKSAEAIGPADSESPSPNILSPKAKMKPVLRQLCSSIQCIRRASDTTTKSNLEKSSSLPDFSTHVALVFGSSCKAFLSFLSVMTLRDSITSSARGDSNQSRSPSEAMLMMESLQKISAIEDEEEQRASLTDLQSRVSSEFRERWKDFQTLRERLESEPFSPKVSETEFALDVVSEGGDIFENQHLDINELMEELNMPQDLREEISSTIQQTQSFYPVEESTFVETERNQSDSEEDVERFVADETKQSPELDSTCIADEKKQGSDDGEMDDLNKMQSVYSEQAKEMTEYEPDGVQEAEWDVKDSEVSQIERDLPLSDKENETDAKEGQVEGDRKDKNVGGDGYMKEINVSENLENIEKEGEEERGKEAAREDDEEQDKWKAENASGEESVEKVEESTEEEMTLDEEEETEEGKKEVVTETEEGLTDEEVQETGQSDSAEETDEREVAEETEEEARGVEYFNEEDEEMEEEAEEVSEESHEAEDIENIEEQIEKKGEEEEESEVVTENDVEGYVIEETDEGEEIENIVEKQEEEEKEEVEEEEAKGVTVNSPEENVVEGIKETEEEEEVQNAIEEGQEEEGEVDVFTEGGIKEEKAMTASEGTNEEKEVENTIEEVDAKEGEEEIDVFAEEMDEEEVKSEVGSGEINEEEEEDEEEEEEIEGGQEEEHYGEDGIENIKEKRTMVVTDEEEEEEPDNEIDEEEINDEVDENRKYNENIKDSLEESVDKSDVEEETETLENIIGKREDDEENALNEELVQEEKQEEKQDLSDEVEEVHVTKDVGFWKNVVEEASYWQQQSSSYEAKQEEQNTESPTKYSLNGQCEDDKDDGTEAFKGPDTDEGEGPHEDRGSNLSHPVEISQELLDFINSALQSSSLIFTYDAQGNIKIEPDYAQVAQTLQTVVPKSRKDSLYGLNCLPSPSTSDLSDYRPETTESGGYNTQDSLDIVTESGEEASERPFPVHRHKTDILNGRADVTQAKSKLSVTSNSEISQSSRLKSTETFSSHDSGAKTSREDLSYFSAASSLKADAEAAPEATQCVFFTSEKDSTDGVLIDQGRWLLKENHLIRKSPPLSLGMYGHLDSTSIDTCQENSSEDTPPHHKTLHNPLAAISSSELEEMAKPPTPKCTYYNMAHGSDSDPFLDNCSVKSGKKDSSVKGRGFRVSPIINTSKTCANKNGSLSSFASVELKIPDRKVHPEGESSAVTQARRTSSGGGRALQAQDSLDTMRTRCGQYCPIL